MGEDYSKERKEANKVLVALTIAGILAGVAQLLTVFVLGRIDPDLNRLDSFLGLAIIEAVGGLVLFVSAIYLVRRFLGITGWNSSA